MGDVLAFSRKLIQTQDLDPTYVVLWHANLKSEVRAKFLLAYFCFYHFGTASWITSQEDYWGSLLAAAATKEHPRSSERRHFRGQQAIKAVADLRGLRLTPSEIIEQLIGQNKKPSALEVMNRVKNHRGFGDWMAFKAADILERLGMCDIQFSAEDVFRMYESPRLGAELVAQQHGYTGEPCQFAYELLSSNLGNLLAPPRLERTINIQEIETCLCKYHSHYKGHYTVGKDIAEVKHALTLPQYEQLRLSKWLIKAGNKGGLW